MAQQPQRQHRLAGEAHIPTSVQLGPCHSGRDRHVVDCGSQIYRVARQRRIDARIERDVGAGTYESIRVSEERDALPLGRRTGFERIGDAALRARDDARPVVVFAIEGIGAPAD